MRRMLLVAALFTGACATVQAAPPAGTSYGKSADDALAAIMRHKQSWNTCMTGEAVRLGGRNTEDASTVVRAAQARCLSTNGADLRVLPDLITI